jgi:5-carboxymethyl-2-hydroxymuconate isomerase
MPHLHLEYTANLTGLAVEKILLRLNNVLMVSGQFGCGVRYQKPGNQGRAFSGGHF